MTVSVKVYLLDSTLAFDRLYTYLADESALMKEGKIRRGMFVVVPFGGGNSEREAIVWEADNAVPGPAEVIDADVHQEDAEGGKAKKKIVLKYVKRVYKDEPLTESEIELCRGLTEKYACTPGTAIRCIRPFRENKNALSRKTETVTLAIEPEEAKEIIGKTALKSIYQIRILEALLEGGSGCSADLDELLLKADAKRPHLKALEKKGYVKLGLRDADASDFSGISAARDGSGKGAGKGTGSGQGSDSGQGTGSGDNLLETYPEHVLHDSQEAAFREVRASIDSEAHRRFLLHGVTGSGKTEVYMHLISYVLGKGGTAVMMVPEISLTPQMISHFTARFGENVAVWHSALQPGMREKEWYRMKKGIARVLVATRSGIFAPLPEVKLVIIDEAHDDSYRSEDSGLRYDTYEVAELKYGKTATILCGSATPGVCMYRKAQSGEIKLLTLDKRAGAGELPEMKIVDMREERSELAHGFLFSGILRKALKDNYESGGQAMLFVGRRGYSSRLFCRDCGKSMICRACGLPMTFHSGAGRLLCGYCGRTAPAPETCPSCGSGVLGFGSAGTERVEQEIKKLFPDAGVIRMDSDTVRGKSGHGALLKKFQKEKIPFLIGTQMITKGHDFPGVRLVGVIDADSQINRPEYDAGEKAFQIISQVAGRAGRASGGGTVIVQTYNIDDASLNAAAAGDYGMFYEKEISFRRTMIYPPFCSLCSIRVSGKDDRAVYDYLAALGGAMRSDMQRTAPEPDGFITVLGPSREAVPRVADRYRWQLTVKADSRKKIIDLFLKNYDKIKPGAGMRLATVFEN